VIPTGPGDRELERLTDLVESIRAWAPSETVVIVDDAPEPRPIRELVPHAIVLRPPRPTEGHPHDHMTAGSLIALRWLAESDVDYIVRLDTDALIIGDYRPSIHSAISGSPEVGVWGAYTRNEVGGDPRDFSHFRRMLWHAALPVRPRRGGSAGLQLEQALIGQTGRARTFLTGAMRDARSRSSSLRVRPVCGTGRSHTPPNSSPSSCPRSRTRGWRSSRTQAGTAA